MVERDFCAHVQIMNFMQLSRRFPLMLKKCSISNLRKLLNAQRKEENRSRSVRSPLRFPSGFRRETLEENRLQFDKLELNLSLCSCQTRVDPGEVVSCARLLEALLRDGTFAFVLVFSECPHVVSYPAHISKLRYVFDVTAIYRDAPISEFTFVEWQRRQSDSFFFNICVNWQVNLPHTQQQIMEIK